MKNMKKIILIAFTLFSITFVSCKKERTCTCETTTVSSTGVTAGSGYINSGPFPTTTDKMVMPKVTKKTAQANCVSNETTHTQTEINGDTQTQTVKRDCVLE